MYGDNAEFRMLSDRVSLSSTDADACFLLLVVSVSSLSARPSPVNGRVGIHIFTFEACSSFTRVTACKVACPPKGGLCSELRPGQLPDQTAR